METLSKQTAEQQVATKQTTWQLDPVHTTVKFAVRHMVVAEVSGRFSKFEGTIVRPTEDFSNGVIEVKINAASINTDNEMRDNHLRSADFFDVEKHPELIFKSRAFEKTGNDEYKILGDLTMHGVTKPVELKAEYFGEIKDWEGKRHIGFKAEGALNRADYGLTYNMALEAGGVVVGEKIKLHLDVEAIEAPETANAVSLN
jgi:polyisoprenoid-binding protein YceI